LRWNGRCVVMRSEWALTQSRIPLRELWPFKAAKIMAVIRLVGGIGGRISQADFARN
jgi:hypothetical protein